MYIVLFYFYLCRQMNSRFLGQENLADSLGLNFSICTENISDLFLQSKLIKLTNQKSIFPQ